MKKAGWIISVTLIPVKAPAAGIWQECQVEVATSCTAEGCKNVEPGLKLYLGDYDDAEGMPHGYYYRCRRYQGPCDMIEDPWIGENANYRAFVMRNQGIIARVGPGGKLTDIATLDDNVLISRGTCWNAEPQRISEASRRAK